MEILILQRQTLMPLAWRSNYYMNTTFVSEILPDLTYSTKAEGGSHDDQTK